MPGLCDSTTGLEFGTGLQWETPIGGAGLINVVGSAPPSTAMAAEDGTVMITEDGQTMVTE